jgi:von Willebrand factor type A domain
MHLRSRWRFALHLASIAIVTALGNAMARAQVDISAWPQVRIDLLLMDSKGSPLAQPGPDILTVKEGGHLLKVDELKPSDDPQSVCILIDASSSMRDRLPTIKTAAAKLLRGLPAEDEVCLAELTARLDMDATFSEDRGAAILKLQGIGAGGATALYDSLSKLADYMRGSSKHRSRTIVLLSDVDDNYSKMAPTDLRKRLEQGGSPVVHLVRIPPASMRQSNARGDASNQQLVTMLVAGSGGMALTPPDLTSVDVAMDQLLSAMKSRYRLQFEAADTSRNGRERHLEVALDKVHQKERDVVRAPEGYYAPSQ